MTPRPTRTTSECDSDQGSTATRATWLYPSHYLQLGYERPRHPFRDLLSLAARQNVWPRTESGCTHCPFHRNEPVKCVANPDSVFVIRSSAANQSLFQALQLLPKDQKQPYATLATDTDSSSKQYPPLAIFLLHGQNSAATPPQDVLSRMCDRRDWQPQIHCGNGGWSPTFCAFRDQFVMHCEFCTVSIWNLCVQSSSHIRNRTLLTRYKILILKQTIGTGVSNKGK